jgi:hypothetical protein
MFAGLVSCIDIITETTTKRDRMSNANVEIEQEVLIIGYKDGSFFVHNIGDSGISQRAEIMMHKFDPNQQASPMSKFQARNRFALLQEQTEPGRNDIVGITSFQMQADSQTTDEDDKGQKITIFLVFDALNFSYWRLDSGK